MVVHRTLKITTFLGFMAYQVHTIVWTFGGHSIDTIVKMNYSTLAKWYDPLALCLLNKKDISNKTTSTAIVIEDCKLEVARMNGPNVQSTYMNGFLPFERVGSMYLMYDNTCILAT
jgi:hypothetical protein